jgi:hypothetical protein
MPRVHKLERAKHNCDDVCPEGKKHLITIRSRFVLVALIATWAYFGGTVTEYRASEISGAGINATMRRTRESGPAAKVADTTGASSTQWCRHFHQA